MEANNDGSFSFPREEEYVNPLLYSMAYPKFINGQRFTFEQCIIELKKLIEKMQVKFKKLSPNATIPQYAHPGEDAGLDMTCVSIRVEPDFIAYCTDIAVEIPIGYVGLLFPRSSNCKKDLLLTNSVGVVDSGYRGAIEFRYKPIYKDNTSSLMRNYNIGDKIGQLVIIPYPQIEPIEVDELSKSNRDIKGYGSSGN